jgi:hypothetical protein
LSGSTGKKLAVASNSKEDEHEPSTKTVTKEQWSKGKERTVPGVEAIQDELRKWKDFYNRKGVRVGRVAGGFSWGAC